MFTWLNRFQPCATLAIRLVLGGIMLGYGYHKVIPHGVLRNFVHLVGHLGLPSWLGYLAAYTEFFGGMLLILGLLTRIVAVGFVIDMAVAIAKGRPPHSGFASLPLPLACLALAVMLVTTGAGPLAFDNLFGKGVRRRPKAAR